MESGATRAAPWVVRTSLAVSLHVSSALKQPGLQVDLRSGQRLRHGTVLLGVQCIPLKRRLVDARNGHDDQDRDQEDESHSPDSGCRFVECDVGWASGEAVGGVWAGDGADGGSGWPIASRIATISCCCVTMISWAMRRSCSLRP